MSEEQLEIPDAETLLDIAKQAVVMNKAFVSQCDREGLGMKTITDHRKRVEPFLARLAKLGLE